MSTIGQIYTNNCEKLAIFLAETEYGDKNSVSGETIDRYKRLLLDPYNDYINLKLSAYRRELKYLEVSVILQKDPGARFEDGISRITFKNYCDGLTRYLKNDRLNSILSRFDGDIDGIVGKNIKIEMALLQNKTIINLYLRGINRPYEFEKYCSTYPIDGTIEPIRDSVLTALSGYSNWLDLSEAKCLEHIDPEYIKSLLSGKRDVRIITRILGAGQKVSAYKMVLDNFSLFGNMSSHVMIAFKDRDDSVLDIFISDHYESNDYAYNIDQVIDYLAFKCIQHNIDFFNCYNIILESILNLVEDYLDHRCYEFVN